MFRDDLIALGLRTQEQLASTSTYAREPHFEPVERLLTMLRDLIAVVELPDAGSLHQCIEDCRKAVSVAGDLAIVNGAVDACTEACAKALTQIDGQRVDQKKEIASLLDMVHEAMAIVSGDGHSFNRHLGQTMDRFEALARMEDVQQLKAKLVREVTALRQTAAERQLVFEGTLEKFNHRVKALEHQVTRTREEAALDPLTRIANRGGFDRACQEWLENEHMQFVLALIDLDDFKRINDDHGHGVGDRALTVVAQALKQSVREGHDVVARFGGDEFTMLIRDVTLRQAERRLRMLVASLATANLETPTGGSLTLTLSCGVAEHSAGDTMESLIERADKALYEAKRLGKNRIVTRDKPTMRELLQH